MTNTKPTGSHFSNFFGSIKHVKSYWTPLLILLFAIAAHVAGVLFVGDLEAQRKVEGDNPSLHLVVMVFGNFIVRMGSIVLILWASLWASSRTWLPAIVDGLLAYAAFGVGLHQQAYSAAALAVVALVISWFCTSPDNDKTKPQRAAI